MSELLSVCAHTAGQIALLFFLLFLLPVILPIPAIWHQCYFLSATLLGLGLGSQVFASELCQLKTTSKSDEKSCFTSSPVLPHVLVSLAILP